MKNKKWSMEEYEASVQAYVEMKNLEAKGRPYVKSEYYSELSERFGRSKASYQYRMNNISYVYSLLGKTWLKGLKPLSHITDDTIELIKKLILKYDNNP